MGLALYRFIYVSKSDAIGKTADMACSHPLPAGNTGTGQSHVGLGPQRQGKKSLLGGWFIEKLLPGRPKAGEVGYQ